MKRIIDFAATLMLAVGVSAFVGSCSDNKKDEPDNPGVSGEPAAKLVEGSYSGNMTCTIMGQNVPINDVTFTVKATDESTADVTVPTFSYSGYADSSVAMVIPSFVVSGVKVTRDADKCTLAETKYSGTSDAGKKYEGVLKGTFSGSDLTINYTIQYGSMPMAMICTFTAPKK